MSIKLDYSDISFKNNGRIKLLIIVGTRPEIIRLSAVITKCREYFDCILAHTGQNYDYNLNGVFFKDLGLDAPEVYMDAAGGDLGESVGIPSQEVDIWRAKARVAQKRLDEHYRKLYSEYRIKALTDPQGAEKVLDEIIAVGDERNGFHQWAVKEKGKGKKEDVK